MTTPPCSVTGCTRPHKARGWCGTHYRRWHQYGDPNRTQFEWTPKGTPCRHETCDRPRHGEGKGYCHLHYQRVRRGKSGIDGRVPRGTLQKGYRILRVDGKRVPEHRLVMEQILGRKLVPRTESVRHKNGIRNDNQPANLELWTTMQPSGQRVRDLIAFAQDILRRYADIPDEAL